MEPFSLRKVLFASGGISSIVTQLQDSSATMPIFTITLKLVNNLVKALLKLVLAQLQMISQVQELEQTHLTQQLVVLKPLHHHLELVQLAQMPPTQPDHQATNHQDQQEDQATQHHRKQEVQQAIHPVHQLNIQAHKVRTQASVLLFHHQMCHPHHTSHHKVFHHSPILLIQLPELHKRPTVTTCHHAEDKLMQTLVYIILFMLSSSHSTHKA